MLFKQLIYYNIHIGHKLKNTTLLASWMLFKTQNNLWLINLFKTVWFFKLVFNFIKLLVYNNKPIWFINSEMSKQYIINQNAINCGEFFCGYIWKRGLLSNYMSMLRIIKKLVNKKITKINSDFHYFLRNWYLTRLSWPRGVFISNLKLYNVISKEAFTAHVPVIGMIDTNIKNYYVNFPIPSNDDSLITLTYISSIISKYILLYKYKKVILWFLYYVGSNKYNKGFNIIEILNRFLDIEKTKKKKKENFKKLHFNKFNIFKNIKFSIEHLFRRKKYIDTNLYLENNVIDFRYNIDNKSIFFFNLIQLEILRKRKVFRSYHKAIKFNRKFYKYYLLNLRPRLYAERNGLINYNRRKWYYFYFYLYFFRFFDIIIGTYEKRNFRTLSYISRFYESSDYQYIKNILYSRKKDTWLNYQKFFKLLNKASLNIKNFKTFRSKLDIYKHLLNKEFKQEYARLNRRPKYLLTKKWQPLESFRNPFIKDSFVKNVNSFAVNLKKFKNFFKFLERELYLVTLIKFININSKINTGKLYV